MKEVRCIHLTNLYSLCEQVARSSTPSTKQKLNQLKLFFQKGKVISPQFQKNGIRRMWFFNLPKIGNLYYVNTDQLNPGQNPTGQNPTQTKPHQAKPHSDTTPLTYTNFWTKPHFINYFKNLKMSRCFFF